MPAHSILKAVVYAGLTGAGLVASVCVAGNSPNPLPELRLGATPADAERNPGGLPDYFPKSVLPRRGSPGLPHTSPFLEQGFSDEEAELDALRVQLGELRDRYTVQHPEFIATERRIRAL